MTSFSELHTAVAQGEIERVRTLVRQELDSISDPVRILEQGLIDALEKVGEAFSQNRLFLPEVMMSARAVQAGMEILSGPLSRSGVEPRGSILIGTVKSDQHDIGKNIVAMMLKGAGFAVKDLGVDVAPERFVEEASRGRYDIVALSALLTPSVAWVRKTIEALGRAGLAPRLKTMVGGAVLTEKLASELGADGYAPDAARAVGLAKRLVGVVERRTGE
jgi:5-methyltetrahydrofolate--homocysteine methyltransferase